MSTIVNSNGRPAEGGFSGSTLPPTVFDHYDSGTNWKMARYGAVMLMTPGIVRV